MWDLPTIVYSTRKLSVTLGCQRTNWLWDDGSARKDIGFSKRFCSWHFSTSAMLQDRQSSVKRRGSLNSRREFQECREQTSAAAVSTDRQSRSASNYDVTALFWCCDKLGTKSIRELWHCGDTNHTMCFSRH